MPAETPKERAQRHEERSQKAADALRAMLLGLATAGIGACLAVRGTQVRDHWRGAMALFWLALVCLVVSWLLVKHRELRRRDAIDTGDAVPKFDGWDHWMRSWWWDIAGAVLIGLGSIVLALGFHW